MDGARAQRIAKELQGAAVGGWKVNGYIDHGGSAVVLEATRDGIIAALKLVDPELVEEFGRERQVARIHRERELIGHGHPHIVHIFDADVCSATNYLYVAMELIDTPTLTDLVPNFPADRILPVIEQIASAAEFLEEQNFAHRDIKPDNVSLTEDFKLAKLLDLGVIRPVMDTDDNNGSGNAFLGTTRYSSPEYLMRDGDEDSLFGWRALTFYQLGALLHDMIMRRPLFHDVDGPPARLTDAVRYIVPRIECTDVLPRLISLAKSCLQKNWRLRLKVVDWTDFSHNPRRLDADQSRQRVIDRIAAQRDVPAEPPPAAPVRSRRTIIASIRTYLTNIIHQSCIESGAFPPIEINEQGDHQERWLTVQTGPSPQHALAATLNIGFFIEIFDQAGVYIRIRAVAALGDLVCDASCPELLDIFSGEVTSPALHPEIQSYLFLAFDHAQRQVTHRYSNVLAVELC